MTKLPMYFLGHGSPINAILENEYSKTWTNIGKTLDIPKAIICFSAHYETIGTYITSNDNPKIIHDFYGFPNALYEVDYKVKGSQKIASEMIKEFSDCNIINDNIGGIDHGIWSILKHVFPNPGSIPIIEISLDRKKSIQEHYDFAKKLSSLRNKGYLIIGSGNIIHNLNLIDFYNENTIYKWAIDDNEKIKKILLENNTKDLINFKNILNPLSIPSIEHFLPLIYIYAMKNNDEKIEFFNDKIINGSLSMTSVKFG